MGESLEFEANPVFIVSSRPAIAAHDVTFLKQNREQPTREVRTECEFAQIFLHDLTTGAVHLLKANRRVLKLGLDYYDLGNLHLEKRGVELSQQKAQI